jgi:hypothetical protein
MQRVRTYFREAQQLNYEEGYGPTNGENENVPGKPEKEAENKIDRYA